MTAHQILFNADMIRAILEGRKTQTRRIIDPGGRANLFDGSWADDYVLDPGNAEWRERIIKVKAGDLLWVRETWNTFVLSQDLDEFWPTAKIPKEDPRKDNDGRHHVVLDFPVKGMPGHDRGKGPWRPGIHMPKWASRITLEVTEVRAQRLKDITDDDAIAEGVLESLELVDIVGTPNGPHEVMGDRYRVPGLHDGEEGFEYASEAFLDLWDTINKPRGYGSDLNPWVKAYTFKVHERNILEMEKAA